LNTNLSLNHTSTTPLQSAQWIKRGKQVLLNAYSSFPVVLEKGNGCYLEDIEGKKYLDFMAGVAVNSLGHHNVDYIQAIQTQLDTLGHCSNLYWNKPAIELAEILTEQSGMAKAFFCNSGTEAMETTIKLARKFGKNNGRSEIITIEGSFHGRTYGALSATAQKKYHAGFEPMLPGFTNVPLNDFAAMQNAIDQQTCAIIVEPIQGEGGIHVADKKYLEQLRDLCTEKQIMLILDEVQCGMGRTGQLFAYQDMGITPDVVALAKGLGGGFPIGAVLVAENMADIFKPGDHGCTFGGNPLACSAAIAVLHTLLKPEMMPHVIKMAKELHNGLLSLQQKHKQIIDVRGKGLMQAIELTEPSRPIIELCLKDGLLLAGAGQNSIRFVPPLIINEQEIQAGLNIIDLVLSEQS